MDKIQTFIFDSIRSHGSISTREIIDIAKKEGIDIKKETINSLLYGEFREVVVRDRDENGYPLWRIKSKRFEAAKGYESTLVQELLKKKIVSKEEAILDYTIEHPKYKKVYHLDVAIFKNKKKLNIEVDGFEHMRADARYSIQEQIKQNGMNTNIEIDWMDHEKSYINFSLVDESLVNKWCLTHLDWCIKFHEELIWPSDITRNIWLIENGWKVMRFWNMEVKNELKRCVREIQEVIMS